MEFFFHRIMKEDRLSAFSNINTENYSTKNIEYLETIDIFARLPELRDTMGVLEQVMSAD